jgi:integrase
VVWYIGSQRQRLLTNCWRDEDAHAVLTQIEQDYWRQQRFGVEREVGGPLKDAVAAFQSRHTGLSKAWQRCIRTTLRLLTDALGQNMQVTAISRTLLEVLRDELHKRLRPASVRNIVKIWRSFFRFLEEEGWIRISPARKLAIPPPAARRHDYVPPELVGPMLDAAWRVAPLFAPVAMTFCLGGFRLAELVNLRRADIDLVDRWAEVRDFEGDAQTEPWSPKTEHSRRVVPLHPLLAETLARVPVITRPDGTESPWLFPIAKMMRQERIRNRRGQLQPALGDRRSMQSPHWGKSLQTVLKAAGITRKVTIHGLRRTFAVLLQDAGAPDSIIRQAMGHAPVGVTETHYLPRREPAVREWVERIRVDRWNIRSTAPALPPDPEKEPSNEPISTPAIQTDSPEKSTA